MKKHKLTPATFIVVQEQEKVLLHRRINTGFCDGQYDTPSGHIEPNELPPEAAVRELKEETGLVANIEALRLFHIAVNEMNSDKPYIYLFFKVEMSDCDGEPSIKKSNKCDDMKLFSIKELPDTVSHVVTALQQLTTDRVTFSKVS